MTDTQVKNTFIEYPSSQSPMPSPLASAPAKCASNFSLKDSLAEAAFSEEKGVKVARARPRTKPDPLKCLSTNSMMSIPESPSGVGQALIIQNSTKAARFVPESWASIPPTPAGLSDFGSTPTGTPFGASMFSPRWAVAPTASLSASTATVLTAPAMAPPSQAYLVSSATMLTAPAMAPPSQAYLASSATMLTAPAMAPPSQAPVLAPRATLSLVDMIQSPKGATTFPGFIHPGASQGYTMPPVVQTVQSSQLPPPPQYQPTVTMSSVVNSAPPSTLAPAFSSGIVNPPSAPPTVAPAFVVGSMPAAPAFPPMQARVLNEERSPPPSAAVALGLMSAPSGPSTTATAVGTLAPATQYLGSTAPSASMVLASATATGVNSVAQRTMPPPPLSPAPMAVFSPTASASGPPAMAPTVMTPTSAESDMKVLLDMAVLSGNQKAVDALLRQAQLSGMSQDTIRSLMPPKVEPVVMSTSPVSR